MPRKSSTQIGDMMDQARAMMAASPAIAPQMEQFWKAQDGILQDTEAFSRAWFDRRHQAAQTALEAVQTACGNGADQSAALRAMAAWQQGSVQRLADDMQEWVDLWSRCAGRITKAEVDASAQGAKEVAKRAHSPTTARHATPV